MLLLRRIIILLLTLYVHNYFFAQILEIPKITNVSVNRHSGMVEISWGMNNADEVDGYIIKRKIFGQPNVVDGSFNTIATISNNKQFRYIDSLDAYGYAMPGSRVETYRVVSYKNATADKILYSNMSKPVSTIYLSPIEFDLCKSQNTLRWTAFTGFKNNLKSYRIYYSNTLEGTLTYIGETDTAANSFIHNNVEEAKPYYYYVEAVADNTLRSLSNSQLINTKELTGIKLINADYASVIKKGNIEVSFSLDKDAEVKYYLLLKSEDKTSSYDTIARFSGGVETITYVDTLKTNKNRVFYKLVAVNKCGDIFGKSNIAGNILFKARASKNEQLINNLSWNKYENWLGGVGIYNIYRKYNNTVFEKIAELPSTSTFYADNIKDFINRNRNGVSSSGKFCYYVEAVEGSDNPHGIRGKSKSNISCTYQEAVVYLPNAINPLSMFPENRTFRPISTFASDYQLIIYDHWGGIVFKSSDPLEAWDGKNKGGNLLARGTYIYSLQYTSKNKNRVKTSGEINLIY